MNWINLIVTILAVYAAALLIYFGLKKFVLNKIRLKRKHIIISMVILFIVQIPLTSLLNSYVIQFVFTIIIVIMMLILMDVMKKEREIKNRPVVGRPKPKLTRVSKNDSDN